MTNDFDIVRKSLNRLCDPHYGTLHPYRNEALEALQRIENTLDEFRALLADKGMKVGNVETARLGKENASLRARLADWDAMERANTAEAALRKIAPIQQGVVEMLRREGFKFETPLHLSDGWEKLAFTLYTTICEVDAIARSGLKEGDANAE